MLKLLKSFGLIHFLKKVDAVMDDKSFIHIANGLKSKGVKRYCPPVKSELQSSRSEVETTCRIASARIHVDRKMEHIKNFRILQGIMPLAISDFADQIFFVYASLTNLLPPLVSE